MDRKLLIGLFVVVALLVLLYGCHGMTAQMSAGEMLYSAKCSSCHNIIAPARYNKEQWQLHLDRYGKKMTDEEKQLILNYLTDSG